MEYSQYMNRETVFRCEHIYKRFTNQDGRTNEVIRDLNLAVYTNEFVVLFGPGECGKTTLLNIMAGLDTADAGQVYQEDLLVTAPDPQRGVVYQSISLFPWLTVMGNVEFGPKARGVPKKERRARAQYYIDLVGLSGFEKTFPNGLSGGMRQRVGIARAYCNNPEVLFMDEPFGALDAQTRYLMEEEISRIHRQEMRTVVFVTNNVEEAIYLADRIVVLHNKPTSVKKEYVVDIPRPRDYTSPEFLALREEITNALDKILE